MAENLLSSTGSDTLLVDPSSSTGHNHHNSVPYHGVQTPAGVFSEDVPLLGDRTGEDEGSGCGRGERPKNDALVDYEFRWSLSMSCPNSGVDGGAPNVTVEGASAARRTLGTFAGVFCPVALSMFSTLLFLRLGLVLGQAGFIQTLVMFFLAYAILFMTILSICAISTNGAIEGGGAYFMISRALGPEFGGSIGILFFFAQVVSCAMYISGFIEALTNNFGESGGLLGPGMHGLPVGFWWRYLYATIILAFCLMVSLIGGHMYGKTNVFTLLVLVVCTFFVIISTFIKRNLCVTYPKENAHPPQMDATVAELYNCSQNWSALYPGMNGHTFLGNVYAGYTTDYTSGSGMSFASVFAILFSSVTGIMNGANMSGELKDPTKSIPKGTLFATCFTLGVYVVLTILFACSADRNLLVGNYTFMIQINLWPPFVVIGIFAATLSAALGNLIGGSRILLALAKDELYWIFLKPATFTSKSGNPIASVMITWFLVQLVLLTGSLNSIANMCSELFLLSYATTNLACLALDLTSAPNFRPIFRYFSSYTAFIGMIGSLTMCFVVNAKQASIAIAVLFVLLLVLHLRGFEKSWGSISQALIFHQVRKYLLLLDSRKDHIKFWRPQMLLMVSNPRSCCQLIDFVNDLKKSGLYILGHVRVGDFDWENEDPLLDDYQKWLGLVDHLKVKAFVELTMARSIREGIHHLIRVSGLGGMKPNTICFGFYDDEQPFDALARLQQKAAAKKRFIKLYTSENPENTELLSNFASLRPSNGSRGFDGQEYVQMIYDTLKLNKNVCLFRNFHVLDKEAVSATRRTMYIDVWPINFFQPESANRFDNTCLFVLQLACVLHMVPAWKRKTKLRVFACLEEQREERARKEKRLAEFLKILRIRGEIKIVGWEHILRSLHQSLGQPNLEMEMLASGVHETGEPLPDEYLMKINAMIKDHCQETAVVFLYLPKAPRNENNQQETYLRKLQLMSHELPPTVLVHGLQPVTSTAL